jgi:integrase
MRGYVKSKPDLHSERDFENILKSAARTEHEIPIVLAMCLGMRRNEILGLRWKDINFKDETITINKIFVHGCTGFMFNDPKSKDSVRTLKMPKHIIKILNKQLKEQNKHKSLFQNEYRDFDLVFCKPNGEPVHPSSYINAFNLFLKDNSLINVCFHDIRHYCLKSSAILATLEQ